MPFGLANCVVANVTVLVNGERDTAKWIIKKLLNGKFTFKSCVVQKKRASLLSENVNRQLAESKEVVGLPFIGNLTVTFVVSEIRGLTAMFPANLKKRK